MCRVPDAQHAWGAVDLSPGTGRPEQQQEGVAALVTRCATDLAQQITVIAQRRPLLQRRQIHRFAVRSAVSHIRAVCPWRAFLKECAGTSAFAQAR